MSMPVKTWTNKIDNVDDAMAADINGAYAEIIAIETEVNAHEASNVAAIGPAALLTASQNLKGAINELVGASVAAAGINDGVVSSVLAWSSNKVNALVNVAAVSTPATVTAPVVALPSTAMLGQLSLVVAGNTKQNVAVDTWATDLAGWTSADDSIEANKYRLTKASLAYGVRTLAVLLDITKNYLITVFGTAASDTDGSFFDISKAGGNTTIKTSSTLTKTQSVRIGLLLQASDMTGATDLQLDMFHAGSGYTEYSQFFIQEITATEYALGLTALMAMYPYRTAGTKSTFADGGRVKATGKNLFDKVAAIARIKGYVSTEGTISPSALYYNLFVRIKPSTQYTMANHLASNSFWFSDVPSTSISTVNSTTGLSPSNANYMGITLTIANIDILQIELGSTATAYELYTETEAYLPPTELLSVGTVSDSIDLATGVRTQRNAVYVLVADDVSIWVTSFSNIDVIGILRSALVNCATWTNGIEGKLIVNNPLYAKEIVNSGISFEAETDYAFSTSVNDFAIILPKGTYADLAATKAALAGTAISYQLATPITTEIEGMGQLMSEPSGSIIIEPAVKFEAKPVTGVITVPSGVPAIGTLESVRKITVNPDGSREYLPVVPSTNNATTITLPAGYDDTKLYDVVYLYDTALTTLPDTTYSFPTNVRGEIDSIGDMGKQTAMSLADFMAYQNAVNLEFDLRLTTLETPA